MKNVLLFLTPFMLACMDEPQPALEGHVCDYIEDCIGQGGEGCRLEIIDSQECRDAWVFVRCLTGTDTYEQVQTTIRSMNRAMEWCL